MERVRLGVAGCGVMGTRHLAVAAECPLLEPVAVADVIEERATTGAQTPGVTKTYGHGRELIADPDVDAIVFAMPAAERDEMAIEALAAGKHVLVEKPVAMNAGVVARMIEARGDRVAGCCSGRFHGYESARKSAEFVGTGVLGDLRVVHCRAHGPARGTPSAPAPTWRLDTTQNGGGVLVNWGCYDLDYLLGICGWTLVPRVAFAQTWQVPPRSRPNVADCSDAETHLVALVRCEGGTVISFERGEYMAAHEQTAWQIVGTDGSLNLRMLYGDDKVITHDDTTTEDGVVSHVVWQGDDTWAQIQGGVLIDFAEAIVEGREPQTSLEKSLVIQKMTDAIYESARTGRAVEID